MGCSLIKNMGCFRVWMNFADKQLPSAIKHISRKTHQGFNLIPGQVVEDHVYEESNFLSELFILWRI